MGIGVREVVIWIFFNVFGFYFFNVNLVVENSSWEDELEL